MLTPVFEGGDVRGWTGTGGVANAGGAPWAKALRINAASAYEVTNRVAVRGGETLYFAADAETLSTTATVFFGAWFQQVDGTTVLFAFPCQLAGGNFWTWVAGKYTVPAGAVWAYPFVALQGPGALGTAYVTNLYIGRQEPGATVGAPSGTMVAGQLSQDLVLTAANALANAALAQGRADSAFTSASNANTALAQIADDNLLTPGEKPTVILDYTNLTNEATGINTSADDYAVTTEKAAYNTALGDLGAYLASLSGYAWNDLGGSTIISGATFRSKFADVYSTRQALLNKIAANAKARLGALATRNTVGTAQIDDAAATEIIAVSAANVTITGQSGTNTQGGTYTVITTASFTSPITGKIAFFAEGNAEFTTPASSFGAGYDYATLNTRVRVNGGGDATDRVFSVSQNIGFAQTAKPVAFVRSAVIDVVAGTVYSVELIGQCFDATNAPVTVRKLTGRQRWLGAHDAAFAFYALQHGGFFAAHIGARGLAHLQAEGPARAAHAGAQPARGGRQGDGFVQGGNRVRVFRTDVDHALRGARRQAGDRHALDQHVRVALHRHAVAEGAGVALVGVAHHVLLRRRCRGHGAPLDAGAGNAAPPRPRRPESSTVCTIAAPSIAMAFFSPAQPPWAS